MSKNGDFALTLLFLLCSCSVGETYIPQTYLDQKQLLREIKLEQPSNSMSKEWYTIFNDRDLNTLLTYALSHNFTIKQGIEKLKQSRSLLQIQSKNFFPMFDALAGYNYKKTNKSSLSMENTNNFNVGFDASWELDIWGKGKYVTNQYSALMENAEYSLFDVKVSLSAEIVSSYIKLREAQQKLIIAEKNLKLQNSILDIVKSKYANGIADLLALNQAQFAVEETKAIIPPLKEQIEQYKNSLSVLSGTFSQSLPLDLDKYKKNLVSSAFKYSVSNLYKLPLDVIHTRPDILATEATIRAQHAVLNQAISSIFPTISLDAGFSYIAASGRHLFSSGNQVYDYAPTLTTPIWHWKQFVNNIEMRRHAKEQSILNYNEAVLCALKEIKDALTAIEQTYKTNLYRKKSYETMKSIMNLTLDKYKNGLVEFTDVANAEKNLLENETTFIESNAQILQNFVSFYKATGGGYNFYSR